MAKTNKVNLLQQYTWRETMGFLRNAKRATMTEIREGLGLEYFAARSRIGTLVKHGYVAEVSTDADRYPIFELTEKGDATLSTLESVNA